MELLDEIVETNNKKRYEYSEDKTKIRARTEQMKAEGSSLFGYRLPLTGEDVLAVKDLKPGPQVKECMEYLMKVAFVDPLQSREEFVKLLKGYRLSK